MINYHIMFTSENIKFWHISVIFTVPESTSMIHSIMLLISTCPRNGVPSKLWEKSLINKNGKLASQIRSRLRRPIKNYFHAFNCSITVFDPPKSRSTHFYIIQIILKCPIKFCLGNPLIISFWQNTHNRSVSGIFWQNGYSGTNPHCISQYYRRLRRLRSINIIAIGVGYDTFWANWVSLWNWIQPDTRI